MTRDVVWQPWSEPGLEQLRLTETDGGMAADGTILGVADGVPFRALYRVGCDAAGRVREVDVRLMVMGAGDPPAGPARTLALRADGTGQWTNAEGRPVPALAGCVDVDLSATPFTNTLPIRRLALAPGGTAELMVAYVALPELCVTAMAQRYTCLERRTPDDGRFGGRYRYEGPLGEFSADLRVDADGLVVDYPGLFRRVWPR